MSKTPAYRTVDPWSAWQCLVAKQMRLHPCVPIFPDHWSHGGMQDQRYNKRESGRTRVCPLHLPRAIIQYYRVHTRSYSAQRIIKVACHRNPPPPPPPSPPGTPSSLLPHTFTDYNAPTPNTNTPFFLRTSGRCKHYGSASSALAAAPSSYIVASTSVCASSW